MGRLTRTEWNKTPYAGSEAKDTDASIARLLEKYGVKNVAVVNCELPDGRPSFGVRFQLKGKLYRVQLDGLSASQVPANQIRLQVKRVVYHFLKSALEITNVFMPAEQVLFAFLEIPGAGGSTLYEGAKPYLDKMIAPNLGRLMLAGGTPVQYKCPGCSAVWNHERLIGGKCPDCGVILDIVNDRVTP